MRLNKSPHPGPRTHEGGPAVLITPQTELARAVSSCLLWEDSFYESGEEIGKRIAALAHKCPAHFVSELAKEARTRLKLRHVPLLLARELARHAGKAPATKYGFGAAESTIAEVIQRPDELTEFLAIYWEERKSPLASQVKRGLAQAFQKFDEYQLAKYNRDDKIKLRDVLFLCHAKPKDEAQAALWKRLVDGELVTPDTWEVALSAGKDKKETWTRLLAEKRLGALALLRNLRNMQKAGVASESISQALVDMDPYRVLPFRFITAARHAPQFEPVLERGLFSSLEDRGRLPGTTILLVDVSGSMDGTLSNKSEVSRIDAACGVAMILRETCQHVRVFTFSVKLAEVPPRRGFALRDAISGSQLHSATYLADALKTLAVPVPAAVGADRLIVLTDEQAHDTVMGPPDGIRRGYMVNVAPYRNEVGYGNWIRVNGFSEAIVDWIVEYEAKFGL